MRSIHVISPSGVALFRFARLFGETARGEDGPAITETFDPASAAFWMVSAAAPSDVMEMRGVGSYRAHHAARRLVCTDFENLKASLSRDRQRLTEASSTLFDRAK